MELAAVLACLAGVILLLALGLTLPARVAAAARAALLDRIEGLAGGLDRLDRTLAAELKAGRGEAAQAALQARQEVEDRLSQLRRELGEASALLRAELAKSVKDLSDSLHVQLRGATAQLKEHGDGSREQLRLLTESNEKRLEAMRITVEERLAKLQEDNGARLDQMRQTVDEKLHGTLERRLGESFKLVGDQLEALHTGLGEMKALATSVGDLKKVMSNVKVRGIWGEVQLGHLLEQVLTPDQYATNVATRKGSANHVEFAIRLPGKEDGGQEVWLPIDAKFPVEDYQRLVEAAERADAAAVEESSKALEARIKACAKDIHDKYLDPPATTDFGILFLPTEGLYAEVIRRLGLAEALQRDYRVTVAGPTTLAAILNSLQMGFRTLTIQKRSSEVWRVLGEVKTEFGKFGGILEKVDKKLQEAHGHIQEVGTRRRVLERKLRDVQELPAREAGPLLPAEAAPSPQEDEG